jgi:hypothetical protein
MAFWVNITYAAGTFGATVSTLDIFSNYDSYATAVASGVAKATLVSGYALSVPDGTTSVRVKGTGTCASVYQDISVTGAPTPAPTPAPAAPTPAPAAPTPAAPSYFYYSGEYCFSATPVVLRFTVDQVAFSTFETATPGVCVRITEATFGPSFDIDLGDGSTYVGMNCTSCPPPPPTPSAPPPVVYEYWDYEPCTGAGAYTGAQYTYQAVAGSSPGCVSYSGDIWSVVGLGAYPGPANYTLFNPATIGVNCGSCL